MVTGIIIFLGLYAAVLIFIGYYSKLKTKHTPEDYFMAGRSVGVLAMLLSAFAANMSAFGLLGFPGMAYERGLGALGYLPSAMWLAGLGFFIFCYRAWKVGREHGHMTPTDILNDRTQSKVPGTILFFLYVIYTIPYLMTGLVGAGILFETMTDGVISFWLGALIPFVIATYYVATGGMRGTVWANVFQGMVFIVIVVGGLFYIYGNLGGATAIFESLRGEFPELLAREGGGFTFRHWFSYALIALPGVPMFPWLFIRMMAARSENTIRTTAYLYNLIYTIGWAPPILLAVAGVLVFPGLEGAAVDNIIPGLFIEFLPVWGAGIMLAAFLAAMMSSMDAQLITLSTLLTRDVFKNLTNLSEKRQVFYGRLTIVFVAVLSYFLSLLRPGTIFEIFDIAAVGFIGLAPTVFAMLYWKRLNRYGAIAGLLGSALVSALYQTGILPPEALFGFLPHFPVLVFSALIMIVVTLLTPAEPKDVTDRFFKIFEKSPSGSGATGVTTKISE